MFWVYEMNIMRSRGASTPMPRMHATITQSVTRTIVKSDNTNTFITSSYTTRHKIPDDIKFGKFFIFQNFGHFYQCVIEFLAFFVLLLPASDEFVREASVHI